MLFNSIEFALFLPLAFILYWFVFNKNLKAQNFFLVVISYFFYGWWDWRFLTLVLFSTLLDYTLGLLIQKQENQSRRKALLIISFLVNLGFLGFFKYFNFFIDSFVDAFAAVGITLEPRTLNIILPVGISFYTFQTLSYTIDVYKRKLNATKDIVAFFAFVCFFPQLVAGPIERATNLLGQFYVKRSFDYRNAADGLRQILWGLFKKIVIADNCAIYVNDIFGNYANHNGSTLLIGSVLFAFQIYGDFSGYSDIAIGTGRLFGFRLMRNFALPYFSRDIAEFWRRWHISLSTWFRDYVYIPLGGSRGSTFHKIRNTFIIFVVSGFWHGANWTFIAWGFLNAIYFLPILLLKKNRLHLDTVARNRKLPNVKEFFQIISTFFLTLIAWIFFRSASIQDAFAYLGRVLSESVFTIPDLLPVKAIILIALLVFAEWIQRERPHPLFYLQSRPLVYRWSMYVGIIALIMFFGAKQETFIYFQF